MSKKMHALVKLVRFNKSHFKFKFLLNDPVTDEQNYVAVQIEKYS